MGDGVHSVYISACISTPPPEPLLKPCFLYRAAPVVCVHGSYMGHQGGLTLKATTEGDESGISQRKGRSMYGSAVWPGRKGDEEERYGRPGREGPDRA